MLLTITRHFEFEAAHRLPNHEGKCKRLHGHSYKLDLTVSGEINKDKKSPEYGMLIDFAKLDAITKDVLEEYDHHYLNEDIPDLYPTAEMMVLDIAKKVTVALIKNGYTDLEIYECSLWENSKSYATYRAG